MIEKLKSKSGYSLTEVLLAVLLLTIFTAGVVPVISSATNSYQQSMFVSRSTLLADTIDTAMSDILRYAIPETEIKNGQTVYSGTFAYEEFRGAYFSVNDDGRVILVTPTNNTKTELLGYKIYGKLKVSDSGDTKLDVSFDMDNNIFVVEYTLIQDGVDLTRTFTTHVRTMAQK